MRCNNPGDKILCLDELTAFTIPLWRQMELTIAFTNGCFDGLHPGHCACLVAAAHEEDVLIVGINSDESVRRLKGKGRPGISERSRAMDVARLTYVDAVLIFDDDTPTEIVRRIWPDVLVKGAEYAGQTIPGAEYAGRVVLVPMLPGFSTTAIIHTEGIR